MSELQTLALHESGHAIAGIAFGVDLLEVTIRPKYPRSAGNVTYAHDVGGRPSVIISVAGSEAERMGMGLTPFPETQDALLARQTVRALIYGQDADLDVVMDETLIDSAVEDLRAAARTLLRVRWALLLDMSRRLYDTRELTAEDIVHFTESHRLLYPVLDEVA